MAEISHELDDWETMVPSRRSRLRHAGFDAGTVSELAEDMRYDLPAMLELIDRGCPPHLAVRIVAPLDVEDRR